ncbi:flagellar transcriptional regulator FlhC [Pigmentiphaga sp.]|jgi:Flagellar transcriptional activator (FlhC).|uniref:flagellar transcriptional regulator FlhC n=1 Tax=Pigmentiphaga sp. TaxID=1977564 RepID=UPI0025E4F355|nr:flagellar transcriptional regulator FlhC [Pigmentiphaga sp.]MBX6319259.1 flagellar transcriptional regulator FlhC [Pigmentiphaga sp.]
MARAKSVLSEARQIEIASELIRLGARLQVLEAEVQLSRERLLRLYREIQGKSPPKGMLPFSTDWFMTWQPNIHSSLFMNIHRHQVSMGDAPVEALIRAYRLYREQVGQFGMPEVLSITRAWRLTRFFDAGMLGMAACTTCGGEFVTHTYELTRRYVCGLCNMPSRAGKTRRAARDATGIQAEAG